MRTSELAARAGVNPQTLRYYERRGLLPEPERSASGYRAYGPDAVRIVQFVKRAQDLGFSLDDAGALLHLPDGGPDSCDAARELATEKVGEGPRCARSTRSPKHSARAGSDQGAHSGRHLVQWTPT